MGRLIRTVSVVVMLGGLGAIAVPAHASFPGGNGRIAFFNFAEDPAQIYTIRPEGGGRRQLTNTRADSEQPAWSPDGQRIAFVRRNALVTMDADGSNQTVVIRRLSDCRRSIGSPTWSPDGSQIAFDAGNPCNPKIFVIDADGTDLRRVSGRNDADFGPSWSPNGERLAFSTVGTTAAFSISLATMRLDGSGRRILVARGHNDEPDWSPDGTQIAFVRHSGDRRHDVFIIDADGSDRTRFTETPRRWEWSPTFSPNGERIAWSRGTGQDLFSPGDIWSQRLDGSDLARLTETARVDEFWLSWQPL